MILDTLEINNFMSIKKATLKLDGAGLVLVQGVNDDDAAFDSNGAGKSTIFEAITYALFEQTVRGLKTDEIINEDAKRNCRISLRLIDGDTTYTISRHRKHKEHKNATIILKGTENITPKSSKDSNAHIEKLIGMDFNTFINSILFGQGVVNLFSTATDREKKEILEKMLNMDVFTKAQGIAKEKAKEAENDMLADTRKRERIEVELETNNTNLTYFQDLQATHRKDTQAKIDKLKADKSEVEVELSKKPDTSTYYDDIAVLDDDLKTFEEEKKNLKESIDLETQVKDRISSLRNQRESEELSGEREMKELNALKVKLDKLERGVGSECPTCGAPITEKSIKAAADELLGEMQETMTAVKASEQSVTTLTEDIDELRRALESLPDHSAEIAEKDAAISQAVDRRANLNAEAKMIERETANMKAQIKDFDERIDEATSELSKGYSDTIKDLEGKAAQNKKDLESVGERLSAAETKLKDLKFWVDGFGNSGIKSYLLDSVTPYLNTRANHYLAKLAGNTTEIEFSTQTRLKSGEVRDKFEVRINNKVGGTSYNSNSTGERKRIDLAISLALQDLVMTRAEGKLNLLLYDEVFDGLDAVGCENAIQLLQEIQEGVPSVFVITHNDILKSYFENTLTVTKRDGETKLSEIG